MTRPTKHPKTGTYLVRLAIPPDVRQAAKRLYGVSWELRENLGTKDAAEARRRAPEALTRIREKLERAARVASGDLREPSNREIAALAGSWYRGRAAPQGGQEIQDLHWDIQLALAEDEDVARSLSKDAPGFIPDAEQAAEYLLIRSGYDATPDSVGRLARALKRAEGAFRDLLVQRIDGDWSPDTNLAKFPDLPLAPSGRETKAACTFDALISGWALDRGWSVDAKPIPRALYDRKRTLERLASFLEHRDADAVTKADVVRWKEDAFGRGLTPSTVRNDISEMSAMWAWGIRNGKLSSATNPFHGTLPQKPSKKSRDPRAFTDTEAALILRSAREQVGFLRWLPWVLCLTGARLNEIGQSVKEDVGTRDGVSVIRIHDEGDGRSVKNADSRRTVPLHPALVAEGFLDYVGSLPVGSSLWPDVKPDSVFGLRSVTAGKRVGRWLRSELGLTDRLISPNHSWRHWFISACRRVVMPLEVRSAITGHSAKMDESAAYGDGMGTFVQVVASYLAKVACPLEGEEVRP